MGVPLEETGLRLFERYRAELQRWGRVHNLAGNLSDYGILVHHFLDSIAFLRAIPRGPGLELADLGSGAGFPGVPIALARPELRVSLIEPRAKRAAFLSHIVRTLGLGHLEVLRARAEDLEGLRSFDVVVSRAVASLGELQTMARGILRRGGRLIAGKGPRASAEVGELRGSYEIERIELPFENVDRSLIILIS